MVHKLWSEQHEFRLSSEPPREYDVKVCDRVAKRISAECGYEYAAQVYRLTVLNDEPFTVAFVEMVSGQQGVGFSKCSPQDYFNERVGRAIAVRRAVEDALNCGKGAT